MDGFVAGVHWHGRGISQHAFGHKREGADGTGALSPLSRPLPSSLGSKGWLLQKNG